MNENTALEFFRYKGKRYTFKTPIELNVIEVPDFTQEDEEDRGEYVVENIEWGIHGTDSRSLELAVVDAEFYFHLDYGLYIDNDDQDLTLEKLRKKAIREFQTFSKADLKVKRKEMIKNRHCIKEKLFGLIEFITVDDSAPWDDNKFFN